MTHRRGSVRDGDVRAAGAPSARADDRRRLPRLRPVDVDQQPGSPDDPG
ncbi:MAG TPA: hypothetical protein VFL59_09185 [Candidatus Nanopelagicales bacterium]|nr:hypothetical protein [Candidatus Nanopelagicales bacterium]